MYWAGTSGNDCVREFVRRIGTEEMQTLADGGTVRKKIRTDLTRREVWSIFMDQTEKLFFERAREDRESLRILCQAIQDGDEKGAEQSVNDYLQRSISVEKGNFYHDILLRLLQFKADWLVSGDGQGNIFILGDGKSLGVVIGVKYAHDGDLDKGAREALKQIEDLHLADRLHGEHCGKSYQYGIACCKKTCKVALAGSNFAPGNTQEG